MGWKEHKIECQKCLSLDIDSYYVGSFLKRFSEKTVKYFSEQIYVSEKEDILEISHKLRTAADCWESRYVS